ncbi:MAG TPA: hypothetical protein VFS16_15050 [Acidimicrobiia bacterium]|nr:hypothetical protein [Acidimicrobiia bacterium]
MSTLVLWLRAEWDRILGTVLIVAGGISLALTYQAVANDRFVAEQMADLASGGLGGLFLVAVGVMLRLQADLHDEWRKLDRIEAALRGTPLPEPAEVLAGARNGATARPSARPELQPALAAGPGSGADPGAGTGPGNGTDIGAGADPVAGAAGRRRRAPGFAAGAAMLAAGVVVVLGYDRAAGTGDVADATDGLAVGVAGLVLAGLVIGLSQLVGRSRLAARKGRLLAPFLRPAPAAALAGAASGFVLVAPGLTRFHHEGCPTLDRTEATRLRRSDVNGSLTACQICGAS